MLGFLAGMGYMLSLSWGGTTSEKHFYNQLFVKKTFIKHLIYGIVTTVIGLCMIYYHYTNGFWFAPIMLIILYRIADLYTLAFNHNHLRFWARGDNASKYRGNWLDITFDVLIHFVVFVSCIYIDNHYK